MIENRFRIKNSVVATVGSAVIADQQEGWSNTEILKFWLCFLDYTKYLKFWMLQFISKRILIHVQTNVKYNTHLQYECGIILILNIVLFCAMLREQIFILNWWPDLDISLLIIIHNTLPWEQTKTILAYWAEVNNSVFLKAI